MPHQSESNISVGQWGAGQDVIVSGGNDEVTWMAVFDGHGREPAVQACRDHDWSLLENKNGELAVQAFVERLRGIPGGTWNSGCTATIVRCYRDGEDGHSMLHADWIGDSEVGVWTKGEEVFHAGRGYTPHPIHQGMVTRTEAVDLDVRTPELCGAKRDWYFQYPSRRGLESLNMDGALGHNGAAEHPLYHNEIYLEHDQTYRIVIGSDGFWQMTCEEDAPLLSDPQVTSGELLGLVDKRWRQVWVYDPNVPEEQTVSPFRETTLGRPDDASVGVMVCYPDPNPISYGPRRKN